jgi:hypothetical protein
MDFVLAQRVLQAFAPYGLEEVIPSTVGEPFLYSHFLELTELCQKLNLKLNVTTNGTFPNGGADFWMERISPVLSDIKISALHGILKPEQIDNLKVILRHREKHQNWTVTLQCAIAKNDRFCEADGVWDRIKILPLWKLNTAHAEQEGECPFLGREAWVWPDGTFQVCANPDARYGTRTATPFGALGNFATEDPLQVWQGARYREFLRVHKRHPICRNCAMRRE